MRPRRQCGQGERWKKHSVPGKLGQGDRADIKAELRVDTRTLDPMMQVDMQHRMLMSSDWKLLLGWRGSPRSATRLAVQQKWLTTEGKVGLISGRAERLTLHQTCLQVRRVVLG